MQECSGLRVACAITLLLPALTPMEAHPAIGVAFNRFSTQAVVQESTWAHNPIDPPVEVRILQHTPSPTYDDGQLEVVLHDLEGILVKIIGMSDTEVNEEPPDFKNLPPMPTHRSAAEIKQWKDFFTGDYQDYLQARLKGPVPGKLRSKILKKARRLDPLGHLPAWMEFISSAQGGMTRKFDHWTNKLLAPFCLFAWRHTTKLDHRASDVYVIYTIQYRKHFSLKRSRHVLYDRVVHYLAPLADSMPFHGFMGIHEGSSGDLMELVFLDTIQISVEEILSQAFDPSILQSDKVEGRLHHLSGAQVFTAMEYLGNQFTKTERKQLADLHKLQKELRVLLRSLPDKAPALWAQFRNADTEDPDYFDHAFRRLSREEQRRERKTTARLLALESKVRELSAVPQAALVRILLQIKSDLDGVAREAALADLKDRLDPADLAFLQGYFGAFSAANTVTEAITHLNEHLNAARRAPFPIPNRALGEKNLRLAERLFARFGCGDPTFGDELRSANRRWTPRRRQDDRRYRRIVVQLSADVADAVGAHEFWHAWTRALLERTGRHFSDLSGLAVEFLAALPSWGWRSVFPRQELLEMLTQSLMLESEYHADSARMSARYLAETPKLSARRLASGHSRQVRDILQRTIQNPAKVRRVARQLMSFKGIPNRLTAFPRYLRIDPRGLKLVVTTVPPSASRKAA